MHIRMMRAFDRFPEISPEDDPVEDGPQAEIVGYPAV